jgi:HSP20 family protein
MLYPTLYRTNDVFNLRRELDRWFDRSFNGESQTLQAWSPVVDVKETEDEIVVTAELAGLNPADVNVSVQNGVLTISGEKKEEQESGKDGSSYHLYERRYGRFERSFTLPRAVIADDVQANFANGLLTITLPKTADAKPRRIQIKGAEAKVPA